MGIGYRGLASKWLIEVKFSSRGCAPHPPTPGRERGVQGAAAAHQYGRHRELMSRRAGAKRGELHEQFAQAAEAAEDDDASTSSKEERPPRHFLQADFEAQARHPEDVQHSRLSWWVPDAYKGTP